MFKRERGVRNTWGFITLHMSTKIVATLIKGFADDAPDLPQGIAQFISAELRPMFGYLHHNGMRNFGAQDYRPLFF